MNQSDYVAKKPTTKALRCLLEVISKHQINLNKPYELILFTEHVEKTLNYNERMCCRLETTGDVQKILEYIKNNKLY